MSEGVEQLLGKTGVTWFLAQKSILDPQSTDITHLKSDIDPFHGLFCFGFFVFIPPELGKREQNRRKPSPTFGFIFYIFCLDSAVAHPALRRTNSNFCLLKNPNTSFSK